MTSGAGEVAGFKVILKLEDIDLKDPEVKPANLFKLYAYLALFKTVLVELPLI